MLKAINLVYLQINYIIVDNLIKSLNRIKFEQFLKIIELTKN